MEPVDEVERQRDRDDDDDTREFHQADCVQAVLEGDRFDDVRDVLDGVEGVLHRLDDVLPVQRGAGLELVGVDPSQRVAVDRVALGLEAVDGVEVGLQPLHRFEPGDHRDDLVGHLHQHLGLLLELGHGRRVLVGELQAVGDLEHVVDDVVELLGQGVDVLAVERRDERGVEAPQDVTGQLVAALLAGDDRVDRGAAAGPRLLEQLAEAAAAFGDVRRGGVEQVEELVVGWEQTEPHSARTLPA